MSRIILARHGDAQGTRNKLHGATNDSLTSKGREESYKLAKELAQYKPSLIYHSPVKRCAQTAQIIADELDIPIEEAPELSCLDMGNLTNKPIDSNMDEVKYYLAHPDEPFPDGESINEFAQKFLPSFEDVFTDGKKRTVIDLTHGRNILLAKGYIQKGGLAPDFDKSVLTDNHATTDHGGYAIATPPDKFKIITPKRVASGRS